MMDWLGRLLGIEGLESVQDFRLQFAAPWAHDRPALVLFCCIALAAVAAVFYLRYQALRKMRAKVAMTLFRAVLLAAILLILAVPVIALKVRHNPRPLLLMLFDGTDSMNISDKLSPTEQQKLREALGPEQIDFEANEGPTRQDLVRAAIRSDKLKLIEKLSKRFRLRAYVLDQPRKVREIVLSQGDSDRIDPARVAEEVKGEAKVTAIGAGLDDLRQHSGSHLLAAVVVVSDFDQNRGQPPVPAAKRLKARVYTVGVGPREARDLSVELQADLVVKKDETAKVTVRIRQTDLTGREAKIELWARRRGTVEGSPAGAALGEFKRVAPVKTVRIDKPVVEETLDYQPEHIGRFTLQARVEPFDDEVLAENNVYEREVIVRDESLKLLFVEYEPTWEWRFVKEVFYRHPMVGREGFRTYLDSADFTVRRGSEIYLETLVRSREEFFSYDVIFLSDVPGRTLSPHFQKMLAEYVARFGGGLVVISGARFGPGALVDTKVADMLPVVVAPNARRRDREFSLRLTDKAKRHDFMTLGAGDENRRAWANLRKLQWYQPSLRPHPLATVLAAHPIDRCMDGKTPQPLIAIRRYGKGEVVYFAFNETWRLRRLYGEKYYSKLWGQLIYRMGLGRALGAQKRFRVETDRQKYQAGEKVRITVEAYNRSYEPLQADRLEGRLLVGKNEQIKLGIPRSRDKAPGDKRKPEDPIYETSLPVFSTGLHRLLVKDPITLEEVEVTFQVAPITAERRSSVRDVAMQGRLAARTHGKAYELHEIARLVEDIRARPTVQISDRRLPLWNTWLVLVLVLILMLGEWLARKLLNLQ